MSLIVILATMGLVQYRQSIVRSKEAVLKEDLFRMRDALDQYFADKSQYPATLDALVTDGYLRRLPKDPFTDSESSWQTVQAEPDPANLTSEPGVSDVKSGSEAAGARRLQLLRLVATLLATQSRPDRIGLSGYRELRSGSASFTPSARRRRTRLHSRSKTCSTPSSSLIAVSRSAKAVQAGHREPACRSHGSAPVSLDVARHANLGSLETPHRLSGKRADCARRERHTPWVERSSAACITPWKGADNRSAQESLRIFRNQTLAQRRDGCPLVTGGVDRLNVSR